MMRTQVLHRSKKPTGGIVLDPSTSSWSVVCGCGYRAEDLPVRAVATLVAGKHAEATGHHCLVGLV